MIIAFLQLRKPAVLPTLHQRPHLKKVKKDGSQSPFADDLDRLKGFGDKNTSSVGELLFEFFRFYAYEFDYADKVLSVRLGRVCTKEEKNWLYGMNNELCVELPCIR
jgi:DNA polymerase sigma